MRVTRNTEDERLFNVTYTLDGKSNEVVGVTKEEVEVLEQGILDKRRRLQNQATWKQAYDHTKESRWHKRNKYSIGYKSSKVLTDLKLWGLPIHSTHIRTIFEYVKNLEAVQVTTKSKYMSEFSVILEEAARVGMTETRLSVPRFARDLNKKRGVFIAVSDLELMDEWFKKNTPVEVNAYWNFLRFTGCRIGEAQNLHWRDIDGDEVAIHSIKTGELRYLPLPQGDYFKQNRSPNHKVFNFSQGVFRDRYFNPMLKALSLQGRGYATKSVRHNAATDLIKQGHSVFDVKDFMGHRAINTTMKYLHVAGNNNKKLRVR